VFRLIDTISVLGSGWLGLPLAARLVEEGYEVRSSTTTPSRAEAIEGAGAKPFIFNINDITDITRNFLNSETLIINIPSRDVESFEELVEEIGFSPVRNVLYVSSTSVYPAAEHLISEDDGIEIATNPFFLIENLLRASARFDTTIIRFGGLIGPGRHPGRFFSKGRPVANPDGPVNLVHLDDCIGMILSVLKHRAWGKVFNGVADTHPTRREFYTRAATSLALPAPVFAEDGPGTHKVVSNEKAKRELHYGFQHPDLMNIDFTSLA